MTKYIFGCRSKIIQQERERERKNEKQERKKKKERNSTIFKSNDLKKPNGFKYIFFLKHIHYTRTRERTRAHTRVSQCSTGVFIGEKNEQNYVYLLTELSYCRQNMTNIK